MHDPRIEAAAKAARIAWSGHDDWESAPKSVQIAYRDLVTAALAAADKAATITTMEELDALPVGAVVLSAKYVHPTGYMIAFQKLHDELWHRGGGSSDTYPEIIIPARVLHWGGSDV